MVTESANLAGLTVAIIARRNPRLHGCTPAWMQVVEPRLPACLLRQAGQEEAAEIVPIPLLWRGARQGGVVKGWQVLPDARVRLSRLLSFPLCGNGLSKPPCLLQAGGFRPAPACSRQAGMTVGGAGGQELGRHGTGAVGIATIPFPPPSSVRRRPESRRAEARW